MLRRTIVRMLLVGVLAVTAATLVLAASGASGARMDKPMNPVTDHGPIFPAQLAFHDKMRKLWEDHITYTRNVIISFELNDPDPGAVLPDLSTVVDRLLQNQVDIGDAIKPYYGDAAGEQLTALLHEHILGAAKVLGALKADDNAALTSALHAWYANAHDIAVFLSKANPDNWPLDEMDAMMKAHLDATTREAVARHQGDWSADVAAYDEVHTQALEMADMLSSGIIEQFPHEFKP
jgi:hypothetical protein